MELFENSKRDPAELVMMNIFFFRKGNTTIMLDAGYNYNTLAEKMGWLGIDPKSNTPYPYHASGH